MLLASCLATGLLVGIDLGTTNSAIALLRGGEPSLLPNARGEPLTPSTVAFTGDGTVLVGAAADLQASQNVRNTVVAAKRFIGRTVRQCKAEIARAQYTVVGDEEGAAVFRLPAVGDLSPEEAGACVLAELLGALDVPASEICRAVVTVPAYFDAPQRQATLAAARLAGLGSVSLLAEPVAASLAYGLGGAVGKVLVLDLGAGTYDASVRRSLLGAF